MASATEVTLNSLTSVISEARHKLSEAESLLETNVKKSNSKEEKLTGDIEKQVTESRKETSKRFKVDIDSTLKQVKATASTLTNQTSALQQLQKEHEEIGYEVRRTASLKSKLADELVEIETKRDLETKGFNRKKSSVDLHFDVVEEMLTQYQNQLGLAISRNSRGEIEFILTRIEESIPNQKFSLVLRLDPETSFYHFVSATPEVPGILNLVEKLNQTNNLKKFICEVRKRFIANLLS